MVFILVKPLGISLDLPLGKETHINLDNVVEFYSLKNGNVRLRFKPGTYATGKVTMDVEGEHFRMTIRKLDIFGHYPAI